jgi:hypothetical protein
MHMMKGLIFAIGLLSMMVAAGLLLVLTLAVGKMLRVLGPVPKLHIMLAPEQTSWGMLSLLN